MADQRPTAAQRRAVAERVCGCCEYCRSQERFSPQSFAIEHVEPESAGGETCLDNLAYSCQGCNNHKYNKQSGIMPCGWLVQHARSSCNNHKYNKQSGIDPATGQEALLFNPLRQRWSEHFTWNEDATLILGLTPTGRATVETLKLNRQGLINLRSVLFAVGEHPPPESST